LAVDAIALPPDELIRAILCAPVDLLWNGGIGTYVKASTESNADVGDKNNDGVRVDADELRCRVVGEGGNLGLTQRGRIEYALRGGHVNIDAIDNAAGVDCSDHEVNIKILLDRVVRDGDLTGKQRDALLADMTDDVASRVLEHNDHQTRALYVSAVHAGSMSDVHQRYIDALERGGRLDRALALLPTAEQLAERPESSGLTMPELAVLLAHSKIAIFDELLDSDVPEDPFLRHELDRYFPDALRDRFAIQIAEHPLRREIIATRLATGLVDTAGTSFVFRLAEETGRGTADIVRAHNAAREIFGQPILWAQIRSLDGLVPTALQFELFHEVRRAVERASRWLLRNRPQPLDVAATVAIFSPGVPELAEQLPSLMTDDAARTLAGTVERWVGAGVPEKLADRAAALPATLAALDITQVADAARCPLAHAAVVHFELDAQLRLNWLRQRILELPREDRWEALARGALRDTLYAVHASLAADVLATGEPGTSGQNQVRRWLGRTEATTSRCVRILDEVAGTGRADLATLTVAVREIGALAQATERLTPAEGS